MNIFYTSGLCTAVLVSLFLPVLAHAETGDPPSQPESMNNTQTQPSPSSQTIQLQQPTVPSSSGISQTHSVINQSSTAVSTPMLNPSREIIVGYDSSTSTLPRLTIGGGYQTVNVMNTSPQPITFGSTDLNLALTVPPNTEQVVQIDPATLTNLTPGREISYYIQDSTGNQIATSTFVANQSIVSQINTDTQISQESSTSSQASTSPATSRTSNRASVRGYW